MVDSVKDVTAEDEPSRWKRKGDSWDRWGRKVSLRFSVKRPEESQVMDEYDRRSKLIGKEDKEFLKACLLAGYAVLTKSDVAVVASDAKGGAENAAQHSAPSGVAAKTLLGDLMKVNQ